MSPRRPKPRSALRARAPERRRDWTLEFAWTVHCLPPAQQALLLDHLRAARERAQAEPFARRVIWVEDAQGRRRPYGPEDDVEE
jgi:hypothetical protein